jgi:type IV pilus assembly protein PilX
MLRFRFRPSRTRQASQRGFSLIVALIALAIMALAAVSLMRTVSTSTLVSGNLAFEQAAVTGADVGVEAAIAWLEANTGQASSSSATACATTDGSTVLACHQKTRGYMAVRVDPDATNLTTWAKVWDSLVTNGAVPSVQAKDDAGNTASYLIQRMCRAVGDASSANGCSSAPSSAYCGGPMTLDSNTGAGNLACPSSSYYRITVRVLGPRGTTAYIQAMVAL